MVEDGLGVWAVSKKTNARTSGGEGRGWNEIDSFAERAVVVPWGK